MIVVPRGVSVPDQLDYAAGVLNVKVPPLIPPANVVNAELLTAKIASADDADRPGEGQVVGAVDGDSRVRDDDGVRQHEGDVGVERVQRKKAARCSRAPALPSCRLPREWCAGVGVDVVQNDLSSPPDGIVKVKCRRCCR